jgi:hypothetical protein
VKQTRDAVLSVLDRIAEGGNMKNVANSQFTIKSWDEKPRGRPSSWPSIPTEIPCWSTNTFDRCEVS